MNKNIFMMILIASVFILSIGYVSALQATQLEKSILPDIRPIFWTETYDFVNQEDISASNCRYGQYSTELPNPVMDCDYLYDFTSHGALDYRDDTSTYFPGWANYGSMHLFELTDVSTRSLKNIKVKYFSYNFNYQYTKLHSLYVWNFNTLNWELLEEAEVSPGVIHGFDVKMNNNLRDYVEEGRLIFGATDGENTFGAINSEFFEAKLHYSLLRRELIKSLITVK